jgi:predicted O-methyltransferase YrrM
MIDKLLSELREYAAKEYVPIIRPETERILCSMIEEIRPTRMLELGAAIGYSSISFSRYIADDGIIITVERDEDRAAMARRNIGIGTEQIMHTSLFMHLI